LTHIKAAHTGQVSSEVDFDTRRQIMYAEEVMTRGVITVRPETPLSQIVELLLSHRISGVPVTDEKGEVVGIVSEGDLLRRAELGTEKRRGRWLEFFTSISKLADEYSKSHGLQARDVMTEAVICVDHHASLAEVADIMETRGVKRLPVIDHGRLVGIISRANLLRALASTGLGADGPTQLGDASIREQLIAELNKHPWGGRPESTIVVTDGVVHFWGNVESPSEARALRVTAEAIPGVKDIVDHTVAIAPSAYVGVDGMFVA
jgi:CBS domain-containing protein